jgi:putative chitobiose transport system permease protein
MARTLSVNRSGASTNVKIRRFGHNVLWYVLLLVLAMGTTIPFLWIFLTSLKGPTDAVFSIPPQLIPQEPTIANYVRAWNLLPIGSFFQNSILVSLLTTALNVIICSLAAYPLAKMKFRGREPIFYLLLATLVVPVQLTYIPSFVLAVNFFHYYDSLLALILPNMSSALNIFLMRQAFKTIPNDLIDAAKIDGASELRTWWDILLPIVRPSLATVAILTFVNSWNDFLWPSLMLHTRENMTLPVGLAALQGMFVSDFRAVAAGVGMTVIPIMLFFLIFQRYFVRGLSGAVKG